MSDWMFEDATIPQLMPQNDVPSFGPLAVLLAEVGDATSYSDQRFVGSQEATSGF